jgi:xylulose-5-phosphate/fructose-6-phosphate phosphoketolase
MTGLAEEFSSFDQGRASDLSAYGKARATVEGAPLGADELKRTQAFWRACNYLMLGMIYLRDNPLLRERSSPSTSRLVCSGTGAPAPARRSSMFISIV